MSDDRNNMKIKLDYKKALILTCFLVFVRKFVNTLYIKYTQELPVISMGVKNPQEPSAGQTEAEL